MTCEQARERLPEYWNGALDDAVRPELQRHFEACPPCRSEAEHLSRVWRRLGAIPEEKPDATMRARFDAMLEAYQQGLGQARRGPSWRETIGRFLEGWWPREPVYQFSFAMAFLIAGLVTGHLAATRGRGGLELERLREEVQSTRQLATLSLLRQQSASERLKGVDWSYRVQPDPEVMQALLRAVNDDPNVNVRLAAVDALHQAAGDARVRSSLIESLPKQNSPMVQIALIDLMVDMREKQSAGALKRLLNDKSLNEAVRQRAEWGLGRLQ